MTVDFILARTDKLKEECYRLRHLVYCIESQLEEPNPSGLEFDHYDNHSIHALLRYVPTNTFIGHVRVVFHTDQPKSSFPVQESCNDPILETKGMIEGSRICVSKRLIKQTGVDPKNLLVILVKAMIAISYENRVTHWCGFMETRFLRRLSQLGIHFNPICEMVMHHGSLRQPVYQKLDRLIDRACEERPDLWADMIIRDLRVKVNELTKLVSDLQNMKNDTPRII